MAEPNRQRAKLWLPRSARPSAQPVGSRCRICGKLFAADEQSARLRHVKKCVEDNHERIDALRQVDVFESITDVEYESWVRRMGRVR